MGGGGCTPHDHWIQAKSGGLICKNNVWESIRRRSDCISTGSAEVQTKILTVNTINSALYKCIDSVAQMGTCRAHANPRLRLLPKDEKQKWNYSFKTCCAVGRREDVDVLSCSGDEQEELTAACNIRRQVTPVSRTTMEMSALFCDCLQWSNMTGEAIAMGTPLRSLIFSRKV